MIRVLFVSHTAHQGGAEVVLQRFLQRAKKFRHLVLAPAGPFADSLSRAGLSPLHSHALGNLRRGQNPLWPLVLIRRWLAAQVELLRWLRSLRPGVVQCNNYVTVIYALLPARLMGLPLVWHMHDLVRPGQWVRRLIPWLGRRVAHIIAVSDAVRVNLIECGAPPDRITTVYNGAEPAEGEPDIPAEAERIAAAAKQWALPLGVMGTIDPLKGYDAVLDALQILVREHRLDAGLLVAGEAVTRAQDRHREALAQRARDVGLEDRVVFLGQIQSTRAFFNALNRFIHFPVLPDSLPTVILEAVSAGCPVVGASIGGVPECLGNGRWGTLVEPGNPEALARAIAESSAQPLAPEALREFRRLFSHEEKERRHMEIYRALLN